jgi:hypothetical protein
MKFKVQIFTDKWNGNRVTTSKQIKQKTFTADGWDEAEVVAHRLWLDVETKTGNAGDMRLTRVDIVKGKRCN